jgi:anti-sigma B factor antagonist
LVTPVRVSPPSTAVVSSGSGAEPICRRSSATAVVVDLSECSFIDSSGLGALVAASKRLRDSARQLALVAVGRRVLGAVELTGLGSIFKIYPSLALALIPVRESWYEEAQRRVSIRNANEQLEQSCVGLGSSGADEFVFICECGDRACTSLLHVSLAAYESVRAHPARFVIARNHENPEAERVVGENGRFAIVETVTGELSKPALESNPRWQRGEPW